MKKLILLDWINKHLWQYRLWRFKSRDKKLERLLPKNQHTGIPRFSLLVWGHKIKKNVEAKTE